MTAPLDETSLPPDLLCAAGVRANAETANNEGTAESARTSQGLLSMFFLKREAGKWQVLKRHENIAALGSSGQLGEGENKVPGV